MPGGGGLEVVNPLILDVLTQICNAYIACNVKTYTAACGLRSYNVGAGNLGACFSVACNIVTIDFTCNYAKPRWGLTA